MRSRKKKVILTMLDTCIGNTNNTVIQSVLKKKRIKNYVFNHIVYFLHCKTFRSITKRSSIFFTKTVVRRMCIKTHYYFTNHQSSGQFA